MARYLISILMGIFALISCDKKEEPLTYEFTGTSMDTLIVGNLFVPLFYITSPPAKVSFYLEGPVKRQIAFTYAMICFLFKKFFLLRRTIIIKSIGRFLMNGLRRFHKLNLIKYIALLFKVCGQRRESPGQHGEITFT